MSHEALFEPFKIGSLLIKNRIVKSPQATALGNMDGTVSERTVRHYKRLAEGGAGLVIVEYTYIDEDASKSIHNQLGMTRREHIAGHGRLVDEVHFAGAKIGVQLAHCGRQRFLGTAPIKSSSATSWDEVERQYGVKPMPMTLEEIQCVVRDFGEAAWRAVQARYDLIEVHAGHGYLITNFLSPHINKRTDAYGGSFENRARLLLEVVAEIRRRIPAQVPLSIRLSVVDYEKDGITIEETMALCQLLEAAGVDVIHASGGHHALMEHEVSPWYMPRALHRWGWEKIRPLISIPIIGSGSIVSPDVAADIVSSGSADLVSLGRAMLADPDWARKTQEKRAQEIVPCIRCNDGCLHRGLNVGRSTGCAVNPSMGNEYRLTLTKTQQPRRVAVVGGGPAGLRAAITLFDKGHDVTLFEPGALGGRLTEAVRGANRQDIKALLDHLLHEFGRRDIKWVSEAATVDTLHAGHYERIMLATGRRANTFDGGSFSGQVMLASEVKDVAQLTGPIAIVGGGLVGCDMALRLKSYTHQDVFLIEKQAGLLKGDDVFTDQMGIPGKVLEAGVRVFLGTEALVADSQGLTLRSEMSTQTLKVNTIIVAVGNRAEQELFEALKKTLAARTELVGTARQGRRLMDALHDGFYIANAVY